MAEEFFNRDMKLYVEDRMDWDRFFHFKRPGEEINVAEEVDTYKMIMRSVGEICEDIAASSRDHWHEEAKIVDGEAVPPPHLQDAYEKLRVAGMLSLTLSPEYNGYGLPVLLNSAYLEMISRADASLMTIVGLQGGVAADIEKYGSDEIKQRYLPGFASGELQGSMELTEPQAGSDLGGILAKITEENGRYFIDGTKIFITNGGAPIHLVLARDAATFNESKGTTSGLSLMLCPKTLPDGSVNSVQVTRTESKLGIHASPTCTVEYEHAEAFLVGKTGNGFRAMLDLMNHARLGVSAQAIGIAEAAYQAARAYADERVQFGAPIIQQPLVKSMLTLMAINIQSARALLYRTCMLIDMTEAIQGYLKTDVGRNDPQRDALKEECERNFRLVRFLTPLCKYYATEISNDVTRKGIQVHGGLGYMAESPAGHYHSDSIITTIYEGTSEIQASFALKELGKGALFSALENVRTELDELGNQYPDLVEHVANGIAWINDSMPALMGDPQYALLNAKRVCEMMVDVMVSAELLLQAPLSEEKVELARSFILRRMLMVEMNARRISTGDASRIKRYDRILGL